MSRRILVIGSGGREHALVRQLALADPAPQLYALPGNPGTAALAAVPAVDPADHAALAAWCAAQALDLVVVGPEDPLIAGVADAVRAAGVPVFGPGADGARLEGDKHWAKEIMEAAGVPTARYEHYEALAPALAALDRWEFPLVVKACGAAQGKGVAVCAARAEAEAHLRDCFEADRFGAAGRSVLIEECLTGPELSVLAVTDGEAYALLAPSRDHKRVGEGDTGPNTGGMGAFAGRALLDADLAARVGRDVIEPTLAELRRRGVDYRGVVYAGLMLTPRGPMVLEYNARFGDPETQVVLPLLREPLAELLLAAARKELGAYLDGLPAPDPEAPPAWRGAAVTRWDRAAMVVVGAAAGYPGAYAKGEEIALPADRRDAWVIHAGTRLDGGRLVSAGGRVLGAVGLGADVAAARDRAYALLADVRFAGMNHRRDIGAAFLGE
ncbi:MAG TPA: phosphoribosylamine--glycine ligase [Candidatus Krumholzibacteria bacterium]|nr:phosphoribosylamine--glycine ligase [Candidatus Krumholzibacteria bacterium]HRX51101.1 phosphoribosylamine--glycine ligase [Candidatus Krumholzibacteria bacterium]